MRAAADDVSEEEEDTEEDTLRRQLSNIADLNLFPVVRNILLHADLLSELF